MRCGGGLLPRLVSKVYEVGYVRFELLDEWMDGGEGRREGEWGLGERGVGRKGIGNSE